MNETRLLKNGELHDLERAVRVWCDWQGFAVTIQRMDNGSLHIHPWKELPICGDPEHRHGGRCELWAKGEPKLSSTGGSVSESQQMIESLQALAGTAGVPGAVVGVLEEAANLIEEQANWSDFVSDHLDGYAKGAFAALCDRWESGQVPDQYMTHLKPSRGAESYD